MVKFFKNGYGVSVITDGYGREKGLKELAVLSYSKDDLIDGEVVNSELCYSTPMTNNVLGWLTDDEVDKAMRKVEALPSIL